MRTPAKDEQDARRKKESVELCGKNRGPHDYMPIESRTDDLGVNRIIRLMCRVCFCSVYVKDLLDNNELVTY
jgi:hypothetical protein